MPEEDRGRIYEGMRRSEIPGRYFAYVLRLWIRLPEAYIGSDMATAVLVAAQQEAAAIARELVDKCHSSLIAKKIADEVDGINAVELLDGQGNGYLAYNDWP